MLLSTSALAVDAPPSPAAHGSWKTHKYSFQFLGFTSTYSCDGLANKLKELLLAAGARADLTFSTLSPFDGAAPNGKPVNGAWKAVTLAAHEPPDLKIGDCER